MFLSRSWSQPRDPEALARIHECEALYIGKERIHRGCNGRDADLQLLAINVGERGRPSVSTSRRRRTRAWRPEGALAASDGATRTKKVG